MALLTPRYYQVDAVRAIYNHLRTKTNNPCAVLPTASGKSICLGMIASDVATKWNGRCLVVAASKELLEQNAAKVKLCAPNVDLGICSASLGKFEPNKAVVVGGIQTIYNKAKEIGHRDIVIVDEAHQINVKDEGMYRTFLRNLLEINPKMRVVGFTATDWRTGSGPICKPEYILNEVCYEIGIKELMDKGFISKVMAKSGKKLPDISGLHIRAGEFVAEDVEDVVNRDDLILEQCTEIASYTKDRKACLIFCSSIAHADAVAKTITELTHEECPVVTGATPQDERDRILARLRGDPVDPDLFGISSTKPLKYCANVAVLTTGTDIPRLDTIAMLRVTASSGLFLQIIGRGFRLAPGKENCLLLDYGRHIERFGPIDTIKGKEPRDGGRHEALAKTCPRCQEMLPLHIMTCPCCGYQYPEPQKNATKLDAEASTNGLFSGEVVDEDLDVTDVTYEPWTKRGAPPGSVRTVRVTYWCGLNERYSEWLCPEHKGYARKKFEEWFLSRRADEGVFVPTSVDDFMEHDFAGLIRTTSSIKVRRVSGEKYPTILKSVPGELPVRKNTPEYETINYEDCDDLPF